MNARPAPNHPPLLDRAAKAIGGKTVAARFTGTDEEAQAILDEFDAKVTATGPSDATKGSAGR